MRYLLFLLFASCSSVWETLGMAPGPAEVAGKATSDIVTGAITYDPLLISSGVVALIGAIWGGNKAMKYRKAIKSAPSAATDQAS